MAIMVKVKCNGCKKSFMKKKSTIGDSNYCSRKCFFKAGKHRNFFRVGVN